MQSQKLFVSNQDGRHQADSGPDEGDSETEDLPKTEQISQDTDEDLEEEETTFQSKNRDILWTKTPLPRHKGDLAKKTSYIWHQEEQCLKFLRWHFVHICLMYSEIQKIITEMTNA